MEAQVKGGARLLHIMMIVILDIHGVVIHDFPREEYYEGIYSIIKNLPEFKSLSKEEAIRRFKVETKENTASMFFYQTGLIDVYFKMLLTLRPKGRIPREIKYELEKLRRKMPVILCTNSPAGAVIKTARIAGTHLSSICNRLITPEFGLRPKPTPDMYQYILELYDETPENCIVIGDRATDIIPAQKIGAMGILVSSEEHVIQVLRWLNGQKQGGSIQGQKTAD